MFGHPLLNHALRSDHVQLQKRSGCWRFWVICQYLPLATLDRCYGVQMEA